MDLAFDLTKNDIAIRNGDLVLTDAVDDMHAALILAKGMVSISKPYMGVGFQERAINAPLSTAQGMISMAKMQIREDGAKLDKITLGIDRDGNYICNVTAKY